MSFLFPSFLFALSAIAIPIVVHLFNFRKFKTLYFSNVAFLKEIKQETNTVSNVKKWLILMTRIFFILFLVLAFSQPYIPAKQMIASENSYVSIFIDNSFSSEAVSKNGTLLEQAKSGAKEIAQHYQVNDRFQLLTNDFEGRHQRFVNKVEFLKLIDEVKTSSSTKSLSEVLLRQKDAFTSRNENKRNNQVVYLLSDFQKTMCDIDKLNNDSSIHVYFIPLVANKSNNLSIDSCWLESRVHRYNQLERLHVRIKNFSDQPIENNPIKLFINNVQKTPASFSVNKNDEIEVILSFQIQRNQEANTFYSSVQQCRIEMNDYPITFDDQFYFSYEIIESLPILSINSSDKKFKNNYINKIFSIDSAFVLSNVTENKIDYSSFQKNNLIILNGVNRITSGMSQELMRFMKEGGSVLLFPNDHIDIESYNSFLSLAEAHLFDKLDTTKTKVEKINTEHLIFKDVFDKNKRTKAVLDLPIVNKYYLQTKKTNTNAEYLLKLQNGNSFLNSYQVEKGKLFLCTSGLEPAFGNFSKHALFVPTLYQIAITCKGNAPLYYTIGKNELIEYSGQQQEQQLFRIKEQNSNFEFIPEQKNVNGKIKIAEHNQITQAGNYDLIMNDANVSGFSFNYNRRESDLACVDYVALETMLHNRGLNNIGIIQNENKSVNTSLAQIDKGKPLWKICIILALVFLALEVLLLRFMNEQKRLT